MQAEIITAEQAASLFPKVGRRRPVGPDAIRAALEKKELPGLKKGGMWFTTTRAVLHWIDRLGGQEV